MKKGTLSSQSGFSLVELMVVVAIIGVLAAMSAGQVQKQIAKARQSEAKTNLATLWSSMETFRSEYQNYTSDFVAAKLAFAGGLRYHIGYSANHLASAGLGGYVGQSSTNAYNTSVADGCGMATACTVVASSGAYVGSGTLVTGSTFTAAAGGQPIIGTNDEWRINQAKAITHPTDGIQ